nr:hypothetical protein Itr_chr12CG29370 [Ipomoea trifida]
MSGNDPVISLLASSNSSRLPKLDGNEPFKWLYDAFNFLRNGNWVLIISGSGPKSLLPSNRKNCSDFPARFDNFSSRSGRGSFNRLKFNAREVRWLKFPKDLGMPPVK